MKAIDWLEKTFGVGDSCYPVRPYARCKDGYGISIQGGDGAKYCYPRELCNTYYEVELGFPTEEDEVINEYAETSDDYTQTVYGYVPISVVEELIEKHGGIDFDRSIRLHVDKYKKANIKTAYDCLLEE